MKTIAHWLAPLEERLNTEYPGYYYFIRRQKAVIVGPDGKEIGEVTIRDYNIDSVAATVRNVINGGPK